MVELAGLYGGSLTLGTAPIGGLRAELVLPRGLTRQSFAPILRSCYRAPQASAWTRNVSGDAEWSRAGERRWQLVAMGLAGCAGNPETGTGPRENTGTAVGAVTGALIGSQFGGIDRFARRGRCRRRGDRRPDRQPHRRFAG